MADSTSTPVETLAPTTDAGAKKTAPPAAKEPKAPKVTMTSKRGRNEKKGVIEVEPVMGTRDFYPEEMRLRNWLFDNFRQVARSFCFQVRN